MQSPRMSRTLRDFLLLASDTLIGELGFGRWRGRGQARELDGGDGM